MLPGIRPSWQSQPIPSMSFIGTQDQVATANSYNFSVDIGPAANNRIILIHVDGTSVANASTITGTIAGVAFTVLSASFGANPSLSAIVAAVVPASGGSGVQTVTINTATQLLSIGIASYRILNLKSLTPTASYNNASNPAAGTLNIAAGGLAFATARCGATNPTYTWTGITEDYDFTGSTSGRSLSGGSYQAGVAETARAIAGTRTAGGNNFATAGVSLR